MANKKYVTLTRLSNFLDNIKAKYSQIGHKHKVSDLTDYTVDSQLSSTSTNPVQNKVIDAEFDAIADAMGALDLAIDGKADAGHNHNDIYYTESEIDTKLSAKSDTTHNHDSAYDAKGTAETKANDALASAKSYTDTKVSGLASTTVVDNKISAHNTSTSAHNDIRELINGLTTRLNTLANSDDTTLDQMSEVVAYIKNNKSLIDGITTSKVNVSDIINNLTTNVTNKPLSAAQGVELKALIDAIDVPTKVSELVNDSNYITASGAPVQSVNGKTGTIKLTASDVGADASGSAANALSQANTYTDNAVAQKSQVQIITWGVND